MRRRPFLLVASVLLAAVAGVVGWRLLADRTDYERALGTLPATTMRATYTDWAAVRELAGGERLGAGSSVARVSAFLDRAFDRDLVSTSAVADSTVAMRAAYGVSPLDASWEVFGQDESGQVAVLELDGSVDLDGVERRLRSLGYREPAGGPGSGGTWVGGPDLLATIDPSLTPVFQNAAVLGDERLLLWSDRPDAVSRAVEVALGDREAVTEPDLTAAAAQPVTATLWAADFACRDLSMSGADPEDQQVAERLVERAGGVSPLTGLVVAQQRDRSIRIAMEFESDDQAAANLQPRVDLAAGDAPGQGGSFRDRFRVESGQASGDTVVLELVPTDADFVFSDLTSGPVLLATC